MGGIRTEPIKRAAMWYNIKYNANMTLHMEISDLAHLVCIFMTHAYSLTIVNYCITFNLSLVMLFIEPRCTWGIYGSGCLSLTHLPFADLTDVTNGDTNSD